MPQPLPAGASPPRAGSGGEAYDLVVVGGGIIGSGIARDAALRRLRVAVVEKRDFGWGTTARSTRLAHGGLRYLEHLDFGLVREALHERATMIRNAPHLVSRLPFLLPVMKGRGRGRLKLKLGLWLYDRLARRNLGRHEWWDRERLARDEPVLELPGVRGGYLYWDAQIRYPERIVVENIVDVMAQGGTVLNHTEAIGLERDGDNATGLIVRDTLTGVEHVVPGRFFLNVAGPWVTEVDNRLGMLDPALTRRTKGVHILVDKVTEHAILVQCGDGERVIFLVPWGPYTLIGTTDTDYTADNDKVFATEADVEYLLDEANAALDLGLEPRDIHYTWAGLRALIPKQKGTTGAVSRRHLMVEHGERGGPTNLVSLVGGKITAYRAIAQDVVDRLAPRLKTSEPCRTAEAPFPGGVPFEVDEMLRLIGSRLPHLTDLDVERLLGLYGARARELVAVAREGSTGHLTRESRLTREEVRFAVTREAARTVDDVLLRRTMLGLEADLGLPVLEPLADLMAELLGWDEARRRLEIAAYMEYARQVREAVQLVGPYYVPRAPDVSRAKIIR
jgi:glycerol-3-phosphate dehydrogenase